MMSEQVVHPSVTQRIIIKFFAHQGVKVAEILQKLEAQLENNNLKETQVYECRKKFNDEEKLSKMKPINVTQRECYYHQR